MSLILPGEPSIQWTSFEETVDRKIVIIQDNNIRKQVGFITEQVIEEIYESKKMLRRTQTLKSDLVGDIEAISIISKDTFKPYKHKIITEDSTKIVEYSDSNVRLIHSDKEKNIKAETKLFENHSVEMVIRLLPLHQGYSSNLVTFHPGKEKIINVAIRVVSKDFVKKCGMNMVESWKIEVNYDGIIQNYWISTKEKELLKQENVLSTYEKMIFERE